MAKFRRRCSALCRRRAKAAELMVLGRDQARLIGLDQADYHMLPVVALDITILPIKAPTGDRPPRTDRRTTRPGTTPHAARAGTRRSTWPATPFT
jgi:hypothetical protein